MQATYVASNGDTYGIDNNGNTISTLFGTSINAVGGIVKPSTGSGLFINGIVDLSPFQQPTSAFIGYLDQANGINNSLIINSTQNAISYVNGSVTKAMSMNANGIGLSLSNSASSTNNSLYMNGSNVFIGYQGASNDYNFITVNNNVTNNYGLNFVSSTSAGHNSFGQSVDNGFVVQAKDQSPSTAGFKIQDNTGNNLVTVYDYGSVNIPGTLNAGNLGIDNIKNTVAFTSAACDTSISWYDPYNMHTVYLGVPKANSGRLLVGMPDKGANSYTYGIVDATIDCPNTNTPATLALNPSGGKVGINNTSPQAQLDVNGDMKITYDPNSSNTNSGNLTVGNNLSVGWNVNISNQLTTPYLTISNNPSNGKILTCVDNNGTAEWRSTGQYLPQNAPGNATLRYNDYTNQWEASTFMTNQGNGIGIGGTSSATYALYVTGNYKIDGASTLNGNANITGAVDISGNTNITGSVGVTGNTSVSGNVGVNGNASISGLASMGQATIGSGGGTNTLNVNGTASVTSQVFIGSGITSNEALNVGGNVEISGTSSIMGVTKIGQHTYTGSALSNTLMLSVDGGVAAKEVVVANNGDWADYVFDKDYKLKSLTELADFITVYRHLPEIPTTQDVTNNGVNIGDMNKLLLKKIEELTLYVLQLKQENDVVSASLLFNKK